MKKFALFILCIFLFLTPETLLSQSRSATLGKDFYVAFGQNSSFSTQRLKLKVATRKATVVNITYGDGTPYSGNPINVPVGTYDIELDDNKTYPSIFITGVENKAVYLNSTEEIALYALNQGMVSAEATAVLPVPSLGTSYIGLSYPSLGGTSVLATVASQNTTSATVTPLGYSGSISIGDVASSFTAISGDVTNMEVVADKPVAVFAYAKETKIPSGIGDADNLFEQIWPSPSWGKVYIVPVTHRKRELVRILAKEFTNISITGGGNAIPVTTSLGAGAYYEFMITDVAQIEADKPVAVSSFMLGNKDPNLTSSTKAGDPSQCWINPVEQMTAYTITAPFYMPSVESQINEHSLIIVTREKYKNNTRLKRNGMTENVSFINPPNMPDYAVAVVRLVNTNSNVYEIENLFGFNAYVYGYGATESYHFATGAMVWDLNAYFTVDTIHHLATSQATNTYSTSGQAVVYRNIEGSYTTVKWYIKNGGGTFDVSSLVNDPSAGVNFSWTLPTDTIAPNNYHLKLGENIIIMEVDGVSYEGKIWIMPPIVTEPDYSFVFGNSGGGGGGSSIIDVLENDKNTSIDDKVTVYPPDNGSVIKDPNDTIVIYTPNPDFKGVDTIKYCVENRFGDEACDSIYVVVVFPTADRYEVCPGATITIGLLPTNGLEFDWYDSDQLTLLGSTVNEITVTGMAADKTYYIIPRYTSTSQPVGNVIIPLTVYKSDMCASITDESCDGSVVYLEDFAGNNTADPIFATDPLAAYYKIPYTFQQTTISFPGEYTLAKEYEGLSDHTHAAANRGRMLVINGTSTADTIVQIPIGDLCENLKYSFSVWASNLSATDPLKPNFTFLLIDTVENTLRSLYKTGDITNTAWTQYGFNFTPTSSLSNLKLVIINDPTGAGTGNNFVMDDLKVAVCISKATAILNPSTDTICTGASTSFVGNYLGTSNDFGGGALTYKWQFNSSDSLNISTKWTTIAAATGINYAITNAQLNQTGYYRLVVGNNATINKPNCVVYSNAVYLHVKACFSVANDYASTSVNTPITVNVTANDIIPCLTPVISMVSTTANGSAVVDANNDIVYTPADNFVGYDSVKYRVTCGLESKEAYLYLTVVAPSANSYWACQGANVKLSVKTVANISYNWYTTPTGGTPIAGGTSTDAITVVMTASDVTYYIQPFYNGVAFGNRIPIELKLSPLCGTLVDSACDGTIFFQEDFGGNKVSDPQTGSAIASPASTGFTFSSNSHFPVGQYSISKYIADDPVNGWAETSDHTHATKTDRGYFMFANANDQPLTYYERYVDLTLCSDVDVYVSAWLKNINKNAGDPAPYVGFIITDNTGKVLANYQTNDVSYDGKWKQYGLTLPIKQATTGLKISLYNAVDVANTGTDVAIDDIEIRICNPASIKLVVAADSVCEGAAYTINSNYNLADLETLYGTGNVLFKWQFSLTGDIRDHASWIDIPSQTTDSYTISNVQAAHGGYYRLLAGNTTTIHKYACYTASKPTELKVLTLPVASIAGKLNLCQGETTTLTASGGSSYLWLHSNETSAAINYTPTANINLQVEVISNNGCSVIATAPIVSTPSPSLTLTNDTAICIGKSVRLQVSATGSGLSYLWSTGDVIRTIDVNPTVSQMYYVEVTNRQSCKTKDSVYVDVLALPVVTIVGDLNICAGEQAELIASGADKYLWSTTETTDIIHVSPITTTLYTVKGTDDYGCFSSANFTVNIKPDPTPIITGNLTICEGESTTLTASGGTIYTWDYNSLTTPQISVSPTTDTQYTVVVTGANGCNGSASVMVRVNKKPVIDPIADAVICTGGSTRLQVNASGSGLTYLWSTGEMIKTINVSPTTPQMYYIEVTNRESCTAKDSVYVDVMPLPIINIIGNPTVCIGEELTLTAVGAKNYVWSTGYVGATYVVKPTVDNEYIVRGTDEYGCQSSASIQVKVSNKPLADMLISPLRITKNKSEVEFKTTTDNSDIAHWDLGDANWSSLTSFRHNYFIGDQEKFDVILQVTNQYGCTNTAQKTIYVDPYIVNTITPNGDGVNDVFMAECKNCKNIQIFDRLGVKLYDGVEGWDGKFNGRYVDADTYFYVITFNDADNTIRKGYITVSRRNN